MGFYTHTQDPVGVFVEKDHGNYFEWSLNDDPFHACWKAFKDFPHKIWVGDVIGLPYRYGTVKKTVAYVCVDEDEFGLPVVEKWDLKKCQKYPEKA